MGGGGEEDETAPVKHRPRAPAPLRAESVGGSLFAQLGFALRSSSAPGPQAAAASLDCCH